jgi:CheY-like chemotaxis protein
MLEIIDTGHGIDPLISKKLFDPYFTTKDVGKGTGMGLFVVQGIVKNHEGAVQVDSLPGQGTTVSVFFPATDDQPLETQGQSAPLAKGTETVLVVDDEVSLVNIARAMLTPLGYKVMGTTFPHDALKLFQADPMAIDLVITDMTMPFMSGEDLARQMMKIRPLVPIVLCTGLARKIPREQLREMGISKCIEKPLDRGVLSSTVRQVLDRVTG